MAPRGVPPTEWSPKAGVLYEILPSFQFCSGLSADITSYNRMSDRREQSHGLDWHG
jgi:hypothetical protein